MYFTACIRRVGEGTVFSLSVHLDGQYTISLMGGYPIQGPDRGYPILLTGVPPSQVWMGGGTPSCRWGRVPHLRSGWEGTGPMCLPGVPHLHPIIIPLVPDLFRSYPIKFWWRVPPFSPNGWYHIKEWMGYPSFGIEWDTLIRTWWRYPPPARTRWGYFPGNGWHFDRLCCGWYAFCGFRQDFLVL